MPLNKEIKPLVDLSVWPDLVNSYYLREVNEKYPHERQFRGARQVLPIGLFVLNNLECEAPNCNSISGG